MRWLILLSVAVMLCWLGLLFSLPATSTPELPSAFARAEAGHMDGGANAPPLDGSYPITIAQEIQQTDRHPVNASLLTMLLLSLAFGASVLWRATNDGRRLAASCSWSDDYRQWLAVACEGPSFLGIFRL
jgi:hypothetical protein